MKNVGMKQVVSVVVSLVIILNSSIKTASAETVDFYTAKSKHFEIHLEGQDAHFAQEVLQQAERSYNRIAKSFGGSVEQSWTWDSRCLIYVYASKESYVKNTGRPDWSNAAASFTPHKMIQSYRGAKNFLNEALPHELTHLIFRQRVGFDNAQVPLWLDEGIALWQEQGNRGGILDQVVTKRLGEGQLMKVANLSEISEGEITTSWKSPEVAISTFYAQSYSLVKFLIDQYGEAKFIQFVRELSNGRTLDQALQKGFGFYEGGIQGLNNQWHTSLQKA